MTTLFLLVAPLIPFVVPLLARRLTSWLLER